MFEMESWATECSQRKEKCIQKVRRDGKQLAEGGDVSKKEELKSDIEQTYSDRKTWMHFIQTDVPDVWCYYKCMSRTVAQRFSRGVTAIPLWCLIVSLVFLCLRLIHVWKLRSSWRPCSDLRGLSTAAIVSSTKQSLWQNANTSFRAKRKVRKLNTNGATEDFQSVTRLQLNHFVLILEGCPITA